MLEKSDSYFRLKENRKLVRLFFVLFSCVIFGLGYIYRFYFWPFLFALITYMALRPLHDKILQYVKKRFAGASIMVVLIIVLILLPMFFLLLSLANQAYELYIYIQTNISVASINRWIDQSAIFSMIDDNFHISRGEIIQKALQMIQNTSLAVFANLTSLVTFSLKLAVNFFFMILILFFLFKDAYRLEESFYRILPFPDDIERDIVDRLKDVIKILLAGNLLIMILQGFMVGIGLYVGGLSMPLLWGSIAAVLSLIPVIGTSLVWVPAVLFFVVIGKYWAAIFVSIWCMVWYLVLENVAKPNIFGKKLNFHPIIFFFLLLGSIQAFGLAGVLIGPILLTLFFSLWEIYKILNNYDLQPPADNQNKENPPDAG